MEMFTSADSAFDFKIISILVLPSSSLSAFAPQPLIYTEEKKLNKAISITIGPIWNSNLVYKIIIYVLLLNFLFLDTKE